MKRVGKHQVEYTSEELKALEAQGRTLTDWTQVDAMTDEDIEAAVRDDPDTAPLTDEEFARAKIMRRPGQRGSQKSPTKVQVTLRLSREVLDYFKAQGPGWQTRIDETLQRIVRDIS